MNLKMAESIRVLWTSSLLLKIGFDSREHCFQVSGRKVFHGVHGDAVL